MTLLCMHADARSGGLLGMARGGSMLTWPTSFMKLRYISMSNLPRGLVMDTAGKLATMSPVAAAASVCRIMLSWKICVHRQPGDPQGHSWWAAAGICWSNALAD